MDRMLRDIPFFVEVAKTKSFTIAAENMDVPISTLSRRITSMEKDLGVRLFNRNTRNVELTESGKSFFENCSFILTEVENARERLLQNLKSPRGRVRISLPGDIFHTYMRGVLSRFAAQYPDIELEVHFSSRWVDLMTEPFDLEVRVGVLPDSGLKARKLATVYPAVYASRKLMEFYPMPQKPEDLKNIPCIILDVQGNTWELNKEKVRKVISVPTAHVVNNMGLVMEFLTAGLGAACLVAPFANIIEESHELVRLLPDWVGPDLDVSIVMASSQVPLRVRLFADFLANHFSSMQKNTLDRGIS